MEPENPSEPPPLEKPEWSQELLAELERQADCSEMNVDYLVKLYKKDHPGDAVWMLVQDINRQTLIWHNIAEVLKRGDPNEMKRLKAHYEETLKLVPKGSLSNPNWLFDVNKAFEKMKNYSKGLLKISQSYALELLAELNVEVGTVATIQVQLSLPPALTIGFERSFSGTAAVRAIAGR